MQFMAESVLEHSATGASPGRQGNRDPIYCPHGAFPCVGEDEWCVLAVRTDAEWAALCGAMGRPELGVDLRYATLNARKAREDEVEVLVAAWTKSQDKHKMMEHLQAAGVPAGYVAKASDLFTDRQLAHRHAFVPVRHAEVGELHAVSLPFSLSAAPTAPTGPGPLLGEHSSEVLRDILGYSESEIAMFRAEGVLK